MDPALFDYELPAERIAREPLPERDASRLLVVDRTRGDWEDRHVRELPELLAGNELIVVNNVRVIPARLFARRRGVRAAPVGRQNPQRRRYLSADIEVLLARQVDALEWEALVRPGRKVRTGERLVFAPGLEAEVVGRGAYGLRRLRFFDEAGRGVFDWLDRLGHVPLPPYLERPDQPFDRERYQTIFARTGIAVAAPTAGLHFTPALVERLRQRGVELVELTLEVGPGTFQPIRTERVEQHRMLPERYHIPAETVAAIERARRENRPVIAVGTTVVRALEDAALKAARRYGGAAPLLAPGSAEADLFIYPGHRFRVVDQLMTNFHLPRSSLLVLVAAFAGRELVLAAYRHAVEAGYRFYSYGDCMLIR
jgi:S-adenosylmethionine:tRNA ribosyltransferase-isomerase